VLLSFSSSGSSVVIPAPEATSFDQLLCELVFHLPGGAGCLILQPHVVLDGCDLRVSKLACTLPDDRGQRAPRYQQVDQIAAEGISGTAQGIQLDPAGRLGLLESRHRPGSNTQLSAKGRRAHAEGFADSVDPPFRRARQAPQLLPLVEVAVEQLPASTGYFARDSGHVSTTSVKLNSS
jgi:hypothetical protein